MSDDKRNFIEQTQARAKYEHGRDLSPTEIARAFAKLKPAERVDHLTRLDGEARSGEPLTIRQAARLQSYTRPLRDAHEVLRRNGK